MPGGSILAPFCLPFGSPGPPKKQLKVCNRRQFQRFDPFQSESFCKPGPWVRFGHDFSQLLAILCNFGTPIVRHFGTSRRKKRGLKKGTKKGAKTGMQGKCLGGCVPLKETNNQQWDNQTMPRTRPGVPSGTVADTYVYWGGQHENLA